MDIGNVDGNPNDQEIVTDFPGYTTWEHKRKCCLNLIYIQEIDVYYWGRWECKPWTPLLVLFLFIGSFCVYCTCGMIYMKIEGYIFAFVLFCLLIITVVSYIRVMYDGAGYYPFYWAKRKQQESMGIIVDEDDESVAGILSKTEQYHWAQLYARPGRSMLSRSARRFVLRPDHFCGWTASWIGKRNHKFFMLFNGYGSLYLLLYFIGAIRSLVSHFVARRIIQSAFLLLFCMVALMFLYLTMKFFFGALFLARVNKTNWEDWNSINTSRFDKGSLLLNLEDICGDGSRCCWFCPTSPWKGKSNSEISLGYITYDDLYPEMTQDPNNSGDGSENIVPLVK